MIDNQYIKGSPYIPAYYPADDGSEYKALSIDEKLQLCRDLIAYHALIRETQAIAYANHIQKWSDKNILYSHTWGK